MKKNCAFIFTAFVMLLCTAKPAAAHRVPRRIISPVNTSAILQKTQAGILAARPAVLPAPISRLAHLTNLTPKMTAVHAHAPIRASVLPLKDEADFFGAEGLTATAFVIEEEFEGQKHLWGVTAAHIARLIQPFPSVWVQEKHFLPITFSALGNDAMTDIAIFPLPDGWPIPTAPLKLASKKPVVGEKTYSFGFFNRDFYLVPNREVKEVTPNRLVTSLEFTTTDRGGACGGPLLNEQGEVVGLHIGSSDSKKISFAVPAQEIARLLQAYRHQGRSEQPLLFNGARIANLNINESIVRVRTVTNGRVSGEFVARHREKEIDYTRLETLLPDTNPDEVQIFVSRKAFSFTDKEQKDLFFLLTYRPADQHTERTTLTELPQ